MRYCRVLRRYFNRTDQYHPSCSNLFIALTRSKKRVSQNTVLFGLARFLAMYRSVTNDDCRSVKVDAYKVRKIGTSLFLGKNCAVQQVRKAGTWFSQSTFSALYFDMSPTSIWTSYSLALCSGGNSRGLMTHEFFWPLV